MTATCDRGAIECQHRRVGGALFLVELIGRRGGGGVSASALASILDGLRRESSSYDLRVAS